MSKPDGNEEIWVIIPARGGSKGIPGKNIKPLNGKTLLSYSIGAAQSATSVTEVFVSTDDARISEAARSCGASVIDRPSELSGDTATSESALIHALETLRAERGYLPAIFVFMQCTSPLTLAEDVEGTIGLVKSGQADSAFTVTPFNGFLWTKDSGGVAQGINHDKKIRARRQDRPEEFRETGAVYAFRTEGFRNAGHRFFGKTLMKVVPPERCVDIDDLIDFHMAELLLKNRG